MMSTRRSIPTRQVVPFLLGLLACTALMASEARASEVGQSKKFGLGGILGQPTGVTIKYHFTPEHALTAALGVGWWWGHNVHMHVDYGYHWKLTSTADFDLKLWLGGGVKFFFFYYNYRPYYDRDYRDDGGRVGLGIRVPVGLAFNLNRVPLEVFLELAPGVAFLPWVNGFMDGGIGVRYYF